MATLNRRAFLQVTGLELAAWAAACAPGSGVSPARFGTPQEAPAPPAAPEAAWQPEWAEVVAAARAEGKLSLITWGDRPYRGLVDSFEQAFPGIAVDRLAESSANVWLDTVRQERRAGASSFDLAFVQPDRALRDGQPDGIWAPLRPLLMRPDVLDDAAWRDGLDARFLDVGGSLCFDWEYQVHHAYAVNTDFVQDGEITTVLDLLHPKWRGRILTPDPRVGSGLLSAASVAASRGTDVVEQLLVDQRPTISVGGRDLADALVRGRHPIVLGLRPKALQEFRDLGLADKVRFLDLPDADFVPSTALLLFDRAPHPAAARLFANWALTGEAQTILARSIPTNSARTDVPAFEPDGIGAPGTTYYEPDREAHLQQIADTQHLITRLLGPPAR